MPGKNRIKKYLENGYYHIYNRGVEKRLIFMDKADYNTFITYLEQYLSIKNTNNLQHQLLKDSTRAIDKDKIIKLLRMNNFKDEIKLIAYCLMPNHFHFLIRQKGANSISVFMNSFITRYSMYFNKKYKRIGPLFQGVYKGVLIENDSQLLELTRYIHYQAINNTIYSKGRRFRQIQPSSYNNYLGKVKTKWIETKSILDHFGKHNRTTEYTNFVLSGKSFAPIKKIKIED